MKKSIFTFAVLILLSQFSVYSQNTAFQVNYIFGAPQSEMALNIRQSHAISGLLLHQLPKSPLAIGLEFGYAGYGSQTTNQPYQLSNGQELNAEVNVTNSITSTQLVTQVNLLPVGSKITPYIQGKIGMSVYSTKLTIEDPRANHTSECPVPLETDILARDIAFTGNLGLGARYNILDNIYFDFNVGYTFGTNVDYMSVKTPRRGQSTNAQDVNIAFASEAQPDVVTEYHVGNLYNSSVEFLEIRVGIGIYFGRGTYYSTDFPDELETTIWESDQFCE